MADISLVFCGEAGQGIQSIEFALMQIIKKAGYYSFAAKEYMSRIRGGSNSSEIRIADHNVSAFVNRIDILFLLSPNVFPHIRNRVSANTYIIAPLSQENLTTEPTTNISLANNIFTIDFSKLSLSLGSTLFTSSVAIGFVLGVLKIAVNFYEVFFREFYGNKSNELAEKNIAAAQEGYKASTEFLTKNNITFDLKTSSMLEKEILINGSEALAFGAIAGGCNFIASYPMSPGTGVLTQLATLAQDFEIIVEQAEDEIAAINMGLGAWYAGGRALVTTAGGGFALMCEGLSLAGMTETPIVINIGQRPGPATGLPTRTEQADLNLALYAGHGEFPRIIFAPGTIEQAFYLMQKAFYLADKYQIPVIILTDQFFADSYFCTNPQNLAGGASQAQEIVPTETNYQRYQFTPTGISPRGIPGFGTGIVCCDSDEHTTEGYITEDFDVRTKMVQKRLQKFAAMQTAVVPPEFFGSSNYKTLIVGWGSNYHVLKEAIELLQLDDLGCLHFSQLFPLSTAATTYFTRAQKTLVLENNATGQFAQLLKQQLGISINSTILKYNGMPFSVEEVVTAIKRDIN